MVIFTDDQDVSDTIKMFLFSLGRLTLFAGLSFFGFWISLAHAAEPVTAILYPDLREPYREVITTIIDGIKQELPGEVKLLAVTDGYDRDALKKSLGENVAVAIALGRGGFNAVQELRLDIPVVVGALLISPDENTANLSGISLAADPNRLLAELKSLAPAVKTVSVVYKPANSAWLVDLASEAATHHGVQLNVYPVQDIKSAAKVYRDIFLKSRPGQEAIWLLPDSATVDDAVILPLILKSSWDSSVAVFSTNPAHAKRGALFAMFPDNRAMGVSLAKLARLKIRGGKNGVSSILPLDDLQTAVNTRTADHLGLVISLERQRDFALTFPAAQ